MPKPENSQIQMLEGIAALQKSVSDFIKNQENMIENYDILLKNQLQATENHDVVLQNQATIIKNQGIITQNQSSIIHNQAVIVKNQAYLKTLIHTQSEVLSILTSRPKAEITAEIESYLEKAQKVIAEGFEEPNV